MSSDQYITVEPRAWEIEEGILIPGDRFYLALGTVSMKKLRMQWQGKRINRKKTVLKGPDDPRFQDLISLMDLYDVEEYISDPSNTEIYGMDRGEFTGFNMSRFYKQTSFREGDRIRFRLQEKLLLIPEPIRCSEDEHEEKERMWLAEAAPLFKMIMEEDRPYDCGELWGFAAETEGGVLRDLPGEPSRLLPSLPGFKEWHENRMEELDSDYEFDNSDFGFDSLEEDIRRPGLADNLNSRIENCLYALGLGFSTMDIHSFVLDHLYHHKSGTEGIMERVFRNSTEDMFYPDLQKELKSYVQTLYGEYKVIYNIFEDRHCGELRAKALEITDIITAWFRQLGRLGIQANKLPDKVMKELSTLSEMSDRYLVITLMPKLMEPEVLGSGLKELERLKKKVEVLLPDPESL